VIITVNGKQIVVPDPEQLERQVFVDRYGKPHWKKPRIERPVKDPDGPSDFVTVTINRDLVKKLQAAVGTRSIRGLVSSLIKDWIQKKKQDMGRI
jgi:hypothetical protein